MGTEHSRSRWDVRNPTTALQTTILLCGVATLCYLVAKLGGVLILIAPQTLWPLWPGCAVLVAILLLYPLRRWPLLLTAGLAGFIVYDRQAGVPTVSVAWLILTDSLEIFAAAWSINYFLKRPPCLESRNALVKYACCTAFASLIAACLGSFSLKGNYWISWRIGLLSEGLAFLMLTPAILGWFVQSHAGRRARRTYYLEAIISLTSLTFLCYLVFVARRASTPPALLYSLVPFLLWPALRLGLTGASTSASIVALLSIWGAVHGRGPFTESDPINRIFSLQLFLLFAAAPFVVLAVLGEERRNAEKAMRKSEERFRLAAQAGRMYAFEWDLATDELVRSGECAEILHWMKNPTRDTLQRFVTCIHRDDREAFANLQDVLTRANPSYQGSYRVVRPDGGIVWLEARGRASFNDEGRMIRVIGMVADVTERKKTEEALRQRERELIEAQRVSQVGSWQWNPGTDEVVWSRELYRIAGRDPNLPPPTFNEQTELYTSESWERLKCAVAEILRTGVPYKLDLEIVRPDGSTRWIIDRGEAVSDATGRIAWLRGTAQDVTERKRAENELRASEEKFRRVFGQAGIGMIIVSPTGRFLGANDAFCECLGYTEEEVLQKTVQSITLPEDWPVFSEKLKDALERGTSFQRVEKRCLHKSGRIVTTESSGSLVRGPSGEPQYFVGEVLDITRRKLAEEALSGLSGRLIEAQEKERSWIARELHDDFNQRIALLAANLVRLKEVAPNQSAEISRILEKTIEQVGELGSDIQALSHRLHSSKLEYLGLVAACASFCTELSDRHKIEIAFGTENVPKKLPYEIALCLFRILQESLQNAVKHSEAHSVRVSLVGGPNEIELSIRDSGVGFDPGEALKGPGIGLTSMKERLKLVDGRFSIDSIPGGGTTIHACVPVGPKAKTASAAGQT